MPERTCKVHDCDRDASGYSGGGRGWCATHYMRWRRTGDPDTGGAIIRQHATGTSCLIDSCAKPTVARGYCNNHYRRWRRWGEPLAGKPSPGGPVADRFWSKVTQTADCWMWTDAPNGAGYGTFSVDGFPVMAHRFSWLLAGRALDPDLQLDHLCRVRLCVNPDYLKQVTAAENLARARAANMDWIEAAARQFEPPRRRWDTPGDLAQHLDAKTRQTQALQLIDEHLVTLFDTEDGRLLLSMPPQEGKSQRVSRWFPLWALTQNPDLRIAIVSYEHGVARRWGRAIRDEIVMHPELGLKVRDDLAAQHEWQLDGHDGGVYTAGIGAALTGRPVDLLIIDDPIKDREQADSEVFRERAYSWWTDVGSTRLSPGAPVVQVATRWHEKDLAGQLVAAEDGKLWRVLNIPAQADHKPDEGQVDPLGREPGEFMDSARRRTTRQWEAIKVRSGSRTWASLFQGHPSPAEGDLFKRDAWPRYELSLWIVRDDGARLIPEAGRDPDVELVQSWDFTFSDTKKSDWVVGQVWLRRGVNAYLLDQVRERAAFARSCQMMLDLTARWPQAVAKLVENKANGPAILNALRSKVGGLIPVEPEGSKYARAEAITPFVEAGNIWLPSAELAPWVSDLVEEAAGFPNAAHDDQVDALSQAVHRLLLVPILEGRVLDETDILDDDDLDLSWADAVGY